MRVKTIGFTFRANHLGDHGHDFFKHATAILNEELICQAFAAARAVHAVIFGRAVIKEAKIIADIIREFRHQLGANNFPMLSGGNLIGLDQERRGDIPEDEMGVTVFEIQMRRADFRVDDEDRFRLSAHDKPARGFKTKCGRRAGDIHIKSKA